MDLINSKFGLISRSLCDRGKSHCGDSVMTGVGNTGRYVVMVLSDGVGTRHHDYVASQTACESFMESFLNANDMELEERFVFSIKQADQDVSYPADASHKGMMATLVAVVWDTENDKVLFDTIGDSRLYLYSNNTLKQISVDSKRAVIRRDPAGKIIKQSGVFAIQFGLTNALGYNGATINIKTIDFISGDSLIACSDGMYEIADFDRKIGEILNAEVSSDIVEKFFKNNEMIFSDDSSLIILQDRRINTKLIDDIDFLIQNGKDMSNSGIAAHLFAIRIQDMLNSIILEQKTDNLDQIIRFVNNNSITLPELFIDKSISEIKKMLSPSKEFVALYRTLIELLRQIKQNA